MEGIEKLPKWAQTEIVKMERKLEDLEAISANKPSKVYAENLLASRKTYLADRDWIVFELPSKFGTMRVRIHIKDGVLDVNADSSLKVGLNASNTFTVEPVDRPEAR